MTFKFPKKVKVDPLAALMSGFAGYARGWDSTINHERSETHGSSRVGTWQRHVEATMAEYAVAKLLGIFWPGPGKLFAPNIPKLIQVSHTEREDGKLIIHEGADDDQIYFFVTGHNGDYTIEGWIHAGDAKYSEYWNDPGGCGRPAYWIPKSVLHHTYRPPADAKIAELEAECRKWDVYCQSLEAQIAALKTKTPPG